MLAKNLVRQIVKRGGTAKIIERQHVSGAFEVSGELNGYDVHMFLSNGGTPERGGSSYYTVRPIAQRGHHDPFSDYNPGGWTFCNRLSDLDWAARAR
jgi:hypothetical protein